MRASVSTVPLKPPPAHLRVTSTGPWLAGTAMEVAAWLGLLGVPDGNEDTQRDILRNIEREGIDVEAMMGFTEANLKELGFRMGDRLKIRHATRSCGGGSRACRGGTANSPDRDFRACYSVSAHAFRCLRRLRLQLALATT